MDRWKLGFGGVAANDRSDAIINKFQVIPDAELEGRVREQMMIPCV